MEPEALAELSKRIERLERNLHRYELGGALLVVSLVAAAFARSPGQASADVRRARGLILEDEQGRERILLGAPAPAAAARKRKDSTTSLVFVDEHGVDRLALGVQLDPQVKGKVVRRISQAVGLNVYDQAGNERGGFSYLDSGAVVLGLDTADGREAISVAVDDGRGYSALMMASRKGGHERLGLFVDDERSLVKLADTSGAERIMLMASGAAAPEMLVLDAEHESQTNVLEKLGR